MENRHRLLEHHLQRQLHITWRIRLPRNYPEISAINRRARRREDRRIRQVKCLCPKLDLEPLLNVEVLEQREIQVLGPILPNSSIGSRQIAGGEIRGLSECSSVEPLVNALAARKHRVPDYIRMLTAPKRVTVIHTCRENERLAGS
jgi:hypothetical protein